MSHMEPIVNISNMTDMYDMIVSPELTNKYIEQFDLCKTLRAKQIHFNMINNIINEIQFSLKEELLNNTELNILDLDSYTNTNLDNMIIKQEPSLINYFRNVLSYIKFASDNYNIADDTVVNIFDEFQYNNHCAIKTVLYIKYLLEVKEEYEARKKQDTHVEYKEHEIAEENM